MHPIIEKAYRWLRGAKIGKLVKLRDGSIILVPDLSEDHIHLFLDKGRLYAHYTTLRRRGGHYGRRPVCTNTRSHLLEQVMMIWHSFSKNYYGPHGFVTCNCH